MYRYRATLVRVVDGDTIDVDVDMGFYIRQRMRLRLRGINTPELRGSEREAGLRAKRFVEEQLGQAQAIGIRTYKIGKYGRYVADLYFSTEPLKEEEVFQQGTWLNRLLVEQGLAEPLEDFGEEE